MLACRTALTIREKIRATEKKCQRLEKVRISRKILNSEIEVRIPIRKSELCGGEKSEFRQYHAKLYKLVLTQIFKFNF